MNEENANEEAGPNLMIDFQICIVENNANFVMAEAQGWTCLPDIVEDILMVQMLTIRNAVELFGRANRNRLASSTEQECENVWNNHMCQLTMAMLKRQTFVADALAKALLVMHPEEPGSNIECIKGFTVESIAKITRAVTEIEGIIAAECGTDLFSKEGDQP